MSDDRLLAALRTLGEQELPLASDRAIRGRLETVWTARAGGRMPWSFSIRRFVPVLAALVLTLGFGGSALGAGADSPLWDTRVALETAGAFFRLSADDRVAYLLDLVQSRTEEAARQEAAGNPGAAAKARVAASAAVHDLNGNIPHIETSLPTVPLPSAAVTAPPANSPSPSPSSSASPVPTAQLPAAGSPPPTRTVAPTVAATPVRTEPPHTPTPPPSSTTKPTVTITGSVHDSAGAPVTGACVTTSPTIPTSTTSCIVKTTTNGSYGFSVPVTPGQTITLYAYWTNSTGGVLAGSATSSATAPVTVMPAITLTPRR